MKRTFLQLDFFQRYQFHLSRPLPPTISIAVLVILVLCLSPCTGATIEFPPSQGPYTGDYVYIQEPGRYTLEENISHSYPVGVIIKASSVILDGQGHQINPQKSGDPSVGIWITREDQKGNPITDVTIINCSISGEVSGLYCEGEDSTEFPWGSLDSNGTEHGEADRNISITGVKVTGCGTGVTVHDIKHLSVSQSEFRENENGIQVNGGIPDLRDLIGTSNTNIGIALHHTRGGVITRSRIEANTRAGVNLDSVGGIQIWDNILDNQENLKIQNSSGVQLNTDLKNGTNIIHGSLIGGNLWAKGGIPVYVSEKISDEDRNGIGDSPYRIPSGETDNYPLIPPGNGFTPTPIPSQELASVIPVPTPVPVPTPLSIITGIHAVISGDTIPAFVKSGSQVQVSLTLLNDGTDDWLDIHAVGIRALGDAAVWGPEWMPIQSKVPSKQAYICNFTITVPVTPGTYDLSYQAARDDQGVSATFGRPYKKVVTVSR